MAKCLKFLANNNLTGTFPFVSHDLTHAGANQTIYVPLKPNRFDLSSRANLGINNSGFTLPQRDVTYRLMTEGVVQPPTKRFDLSNRDACFSGISIIHTSDRGFQQASVQLDNHII